MTGPGRDWFAADTLTGSGVRLVALRLSDAAEYLAALGTPEQRSEVLAHLTFAPPRDLDAARRVVGQALTDPDRMPFAQRLAGTGEFVGTTSFYEISPAVRAIAIGHTWLARPHWRTGVNTEAKLLMMTHAFDTLGAQRVVWHTDIRNVRSQQAIARLGAQREGVLRGTTASDPTAAGATPCNSPCWPTSGPPRASGCGAASTPAPGENRTPRPSARAGGADWTA